MFPAQPQLLSRATKKNIQKKVIQMLYELNSRERQKDREKERDRRIKEKLKIQLVVIAITFNGNFFPETR